MQNPTQDCPIPQVKMTQWDCHAMDGGSVNRVGGLACPGPSPR
jgi:hypothetical protein